MAVPICHRNNLFLWMKKQNCYFTGMFYDSVSVEMMTILRFFLHVYHLMG